MTSGCLGGRGDAINMQSDTWGGGVIDKQLRRWMQYRLSGVENENSFMVKVRVGYAVEKTDKSTALSSYWYIFTNLVVLHSSK